MTLKIMVDTSPAEFIGAVQLENSLLGERVNIVIVTTG